MLAIWTACYFGTGFCSTEINNLCTGHEERVLGAYHIEGTGATAKPERMSGEAVRSLRRNGAEPPNERMD